MSIANIETLDITKDALDNIEDIDSFKNMIDLIAGAGVSQSNQLDFKGSLALNM